MKFIKRLYANICEVIIAMGMTSFSRLNKPSVVLCVMRIFATKMERNSVIDKQKITPRGAMHDGGTAIPRVSTVHDL